MEPRSTTKRPVLILGVEPRISIAIARSLDAHGIPVDVASLSSREPVPHSRSVRNFVRLPAASPAFIETLDELISARQYDTLFPATDAALGAIAQNDRRLRNLLKLACPPAEVVQKVLNKSETLNIAEQCGIRIPRTFRATSLRELDALEPTLTFPVVAKPFHKKEETGFKVRYFKTIDELRKAMLADDKLGDRILLQEYCVGDGVGVELLIHEGRTVAAFQHRRIKEVPYSGGASVVAVGEEPDPELVDQATKLLRALDWEGAAMVEFRFSRPERSIALMEVNGRYWGTVSLAIESGVDFPLYEWQLLHGETPHVVASYASGRKWRWTTGYIRRFHGLATAAMSTPAARRVLKSELSHPLADLGFNIHDSLWKFSDPGPAVFELARAVTDLLKTDAKAAWKGVWRQGVRSKNHRLESQKAGPGIL